MTLEFEFFEKETKELTLFTDEEFINHNLETTGHQTLKYSVVVKENKEIQAVSRGGLFNNALYISDFIVAKSCRKSGVGSKLISEIEKHAKKKNCKKIWVDTYDYQAPDFYKKNGYIEKGRIENYRGEYAKIFFEKEV